MKEFIDILKNKFISSKEAKNASWLIGGKIAQMTLSLVISIITARYLGPGNYGVINYGQAYVGFFTAFCTLGINSVIIKDFVDHPDQKGEAIGTTLVLRAISSILSAIMIVSIVSVVDYGEKETIIVAALCSVALLFQVFDTFNYWFQSKYQSKVTATASFIAYLVISVYKISLLILKKSVRWFAFSTSLDYIAVAVVLLYAYRRNNGPKLSFSMDKAKALLGKSYHYILSAMMVAIYWQTDKLMLKHMMSSNEVGYYSIATSICVVWVFVLQAIIDSLFPTILYLYDVDKEAFVRKNKQLYAIVFYVSMAVAVCITIFGGIAVKIMYGEMYLPSVGPLRIATWYTAFSYLAVARNAWVVCNNKQKYLKYLNLGAAIVNVILNLLLIPILGANGAALASLITQITTCILIPLMIKDMRENAMMMIEAIWLKGVR